MHPYDRGVGPLTRPGRSLADDRMPRSDTESLGTLVC